MPLPPQIAQYLAKLGHDAIHASNAGLNSVSDEVIMERARQEGRAIITADLDYPRLLAISGADNPGIILYRGGNWNEKDCVEKLARVLQLFSPEAIQKSMIVIERSRIRRRDLPL